MRLYARPSLRLVRQVLSDLFVVAWTAAWWSVGRLVDAAIRALAEPARQTATVTSALKRQVADAAAQAGSLAMVGDGLRQPFDGIAGNLDGIVAAANAQVASLEQAATVAGAVVFLVPVALLVARWLPARLRFARHARTTLALLNAPGGTELLALRALTRRSLPELKAAASDPVGAWRRGDPDALARLADLELASAGVKRPAAGRPTRAVRPADR